MKPELLPCMYVLLLCCGVQLFQKIDFGTYFVYHNELLVVSAASFALALFFLTFTRHSCNKSTRTFSLLRGLWVLDLDGCYGAGFVWFAVLHIFSDDAPASLSFYVVFTAFVENLPVKNGEQNYNWLKIMGYC